MNLTERRLEFDVHEEHMRRNGYSMSQNQMVEIPNGTLSIENCGECPLVTVRCLHTLNKWWLSTPNPETGQEVWEKIELDDPRLQTPPYNSLDVDQSPTKLLCEFCGLDVT